eukprot:15443060-Alexandrium_andersonii.AAC.1
MPDAGGGERQAEEQASFDATRDEMSVEGIPEEQISKMVGATAMNEKSVAMKVEPGKEGQAPSHEG